MNAVYSPAEESHMGAKQRAADTLAMSPLASLNNRKREVILITKKNVLFATITSLRCRMRVKRGSICHNWRE